MKKHGEADLCAQRGLESGPECYQQKPVVFLKLASSSDQCSKMQIASVAFAAKSTSPALLKQRICIWSMIKIQM